MRKCKNIRFWKREALVRSSLEWTTCLRLSELAKHRFEAVRFSSLPSCRVHLPDTHNRQLSPNSMSTSSWWLHWARSCLAYKCSMYRSGHNLGRHISLVYDRSGIFRLSCFSQTLSSSPWTSWKVGSSSPYVWDEIAYDTSEELTKNFGLSSFTFKSHILIYCFPEYRVNVIWLRWRIRLPPVR